MNARAAKANHMARDSTPSVRRWKPSLYNQFHLDSKCEGLDCSLYSLTMPDQNSRLCFECVGEAFLRAKIQDRGKDDTCSYCGKTCKTFSLDEITDEMEIALEEHFYLTATEPSGLEYVMHKEGERDWEREGELLVDVIGEYAEIEPKPAEDIRQLLDERHFDIELARMGDESPFGKDAQYAEAGVDDFKSQTGWFQFEQRLKTEARYFSRTAEDVLESVFAGIAEFKTHDGFPVVVNAGPGMKIASLYRARVFQSSEKLKEALGRPDREIGPPPSRAATAGRMNARKKRSNTSSRFKGVCFYRAYRKWRAVIDLGRPVHIGYFTQELDAALAYDAVAREHFGDFAHTNLPPKLPCIGIPLASTMSAEGVPA